MHFSIITPENIFFSGAVTQVVIPGVEGEFGVLPGHAPFISTLKPGIVTIEAEDGSRVRVAILGGVAEAIPERCTVLAEVARALADVSREQATSELQAAEKAERDAVSEKDIQTAERQRLLAETVIAGL